MAKTSSVNLDPHVYDRAQALAKESGRTIHDLLNDILPRALDEWEHRGLLRDLIEDAPDTERAHLAALCEFFEIRAKELDKYAFSVVSRMTEAYRDDHLEHLREQVKEVVALRKEVEEVLDEDAKQQEDKGGDEKEEVSSEGVVPAEGRRRIKKTRGNKMKGEN